MKYSKNYPFIYYIIQYKQKKEQNILRPMYNKRHYDVRRQLLKAFNLNEIPHFQVHLF